MSPLDAAYFRRPRGRKKPRTYQVTIQYEQDIADFEDAARRLGQFDMGAFLVFAGRVAAWLLSEVAAVQAEAAGEDKP